MQGLILAAGYGKRLLPYTKDIPKALLAIDEGKTILEHILDNFIQAGLVDIVIVVGHAKDKVITLIGTKYKGAQITYCINEQYLTTNTDASVWSAREVIRGPFIQSHGDILFHHTILKKVVSSSILDGVVIDSTAQGRDEDANRIATEQKMITGRVLALNKIMPLSEAVGISCGLYKFSQEGRDCYFKHIGALDLLQNGGFEIPLREVFKDRPFFPIDVHGLPFITIDVPQDILQAQALVASGLL